MNEKKNEFLLKKDITFLNHGSFGSCPIPVFEEYQKWQKILENQPDQFFKNELWNAIEHSRVSLGEFVGCNQEDILFFQNPTTAVSNIIHSLNLKMDDEVLMTDHEYGALVRAWNKFAKNQNIKIIEQKIPIAVESSEEFVENFWQGVTERTKVIFISHITSPTALIFPIKEIIDRAKKHGILTIVDGAHVPGHIELDIGALGCDFYTGALHKWLCAPKGCSFLYVKRTHQNWVKPIVYSWGKDGNDTSSSQFLQDFQWQGTRDMSSFLTVPYAIKYFKNYIYPFRKYCRQINRDTSSRFVSLFKTQAIFSGDDWIAQMVSHPLPINAPENLADILWNEYKIVIPIFDWQGIKFIRSSTQIYNDSSDIDLLMRALKSVL